MKQFNIFLEQGFLHILDLSGYDHILFLFAICAIYDLKDKKQILWIISSFTLAHSLSLALSALKLVVVNTDLVEFLIAGTILFTCLENLFFKHLHRYRIIFSFLFGLVHGLGFSELLQELFMGMDFNLLNTLLPFNIGLEAGQLVIILVILGLILFIQKIIKLDKKLINYIISVPAAIQAFIWIIHRWPYQNIKLF